MFTNQSICSALFSAERLSQELPAFVLSDRSTLSYRSTAFAVQRLAERLRACGVRAGMRVAFLAPRGPLGVVGFLAISEVATCCPLNPRLKPQELAGVLSSMDISVLVHTGLDTVVRVTAEGAGVSVLAINGAFESLSVAQNPPIKAFAPFNGTYPAMLMATSGTTSQPKLVPLFHQQILSAAGAIGEAFNLGRDDLCLNPMPLHHVHGLISAALSSLLAGSPVHCSDGFSPAGFNTLFTELKPTWFTGSPAMHLALREYYEVGTAHADNERLRFFRSSSAPLPPSAIEALETIFSAPLIETYGLTETASMICSNPLVPGVRKAGSVGVAFGADIKIVGPDGASLEAGGIGEIAIMGPSVIDTYLDGFASSSFADGWLLTGDIGRLDEDGYLYIVGRMKEVIKRGGHSVYPAEVDDALSALADVAEAVTFPVPHGSLGEDVVAAVVLRSGSAITSTAIREYVADKISTYKVPSLILIVPDIQKNETGKIVRRQVYEHLSTMLAPECIEPKNDTEQRLLDIWFSVLNRQDIGVTDNVFLHGGDPLKANQAVEKIASTGLCPLTLKDLLAAPTVREQAAKVGAQ